MSPPTRRTILVSILVGIAIGGAFALEQLLTARPDRPFGHTHPGHVTGWIGLGLILLVFVYSYRKRTAPTRRWPKGWFRVHMAAGVAGPLLILVHAGNHFHALVPILAMLAMGLVVLSGIIGQAVHYMVLRTLHDQRRELIDQGLSDDEIDARLHTMASQEKAFRFWQYLHAPVTLTFLVLTLLHMGGALFFGGF
ncbi:MAG: hypothetical protein EPO64_11100 [Nitrospirae bacterium]|nr:MAG: hypothetical protein EPO64_11100 [Nitrospirota bacterium]